MFKKWQQLLAIGVAVTALGACGPGLDSLAPYAIGGTVTGLNGTLVLQNNGGDNLSITGNGSFKFSKELLSDAAYVVTVLTQPSGQFCTVSSGSGTATTEVTTVSVQCVVPWTKQLGAGANTSTYGSSIAIDASGNIYVAGDTSGGLDGNTVAGTNDSFVTKYNSSGGKQYTNQLGVLGAATDGLSVATFTDNAGNTSVFVAGQTTGALPLPNNKTLRTGATDVFVTTYDGFSALRYTRQLGVALKNTIGRSVTTDINGNVFVAGQTDGPLVGTLAGNTDFFFTKYLADGTETSTKQLGAAGASTIGTSVATDSSGDVFVVGHTTGSLPGSNLTGNTDLFIAKYSHVDLSVIYIKQLGFALANTYGRAIAIDRIGNVFVAGQTNGELPNVTSPSNNKRTGATDFFVAKYANDGTLLYTRQLGALGAATDGLSVATDASGNVFVAGQTSGDLDGNKRTGTIDFFVTKYNNIGEKQYTRQLGVALKDTIGRAVATDASGNVYVAGDTSGGLDGNTLSGTGATDFFIVKYNSSGVKQ